MTRRNTMLRGDGGLRRVGRDQGCRDWKVITVTEPVSGKDHSSLADKAPRLSTLGGFRKSV